MTDATQKTRRPRVALIGGLYVPFEIVTGPYGPRGGNRQYIQYWGVGYDSQDRAARAIKITEAFGTTPAGVRVSIYTGERA